MTDQEIIEAAARAYNEVEAVRRCSLNESLNCHDQIRCACQLDAMAAAFAVIAPAVRERCAAEKTLHIPQYIVQRIEFRALAFHNRVVAKVAREDGATKLADFLERQADQFTATHDRLAALPLDGLTGGKGDSVRALAPPAKGESQ